MTLPVGSLVLMNDQDNLGPSRVQERNRDGSVRIEPLWQGEALLLAARAASMDRFPLLTGARVLARKEALASEDTSLPSKGGWVEARIAAVADPGPQALRQVTLEVKGRAVQVDERAVMPMRPDPTDVMGLFEALGWRGPSRFYARLGMLRDAARWYEESDGIPALLGSRVTPKGHQVFAARRILWDRAPRFILADEVGLGKTIEAGLVLQTLIAADPDLNVLLIAPGSMTRQWLCEMYLRFGARVFHHLDAARWRKTPRRQRDVLLDSDRLIVSTGALLADGDLRTALTERPWDVVVIDEAHQVPAHHPLFPLFRQLAEETPGFLVLSATPSRRETSGLLSLLSLVSPDIYRPDDEEGLRTRLALKQAVWDKLAFSIQIQREAVFEQTELAAESLDMLVSEWTGVLNHDPVVQGLLSRMRQGEASALDELIAYVQEFHRIDHRLIRTRRVTLSGMGSRFSERLHEVLTYRPSSTETLLAEHVESLPDGKDDLQKALRGWYQLALSGTPERFLALLDRRLQGLDQSFGAVGLVNALTSDPGPEEEEALLDDLVAAAPQMDGERQWLETARGLTLDWLAANRKGCARHLAAIDWIQSHLDADKAHKVLVFARDSRVAEEFAQRAAERLGEGAVGLFHHRLPDEDLATVTLRFQRRSACRLLVSDELGGEGRNFQMASVILHLDQPWTVGRLEQRIGRLDRMGRDPDRPILSVIMEGPALIESVLTDLHTNVFGTYRRSIGGLEFALPRLQRQVFDALCSGAETLSALIPDLRAEVERELGQTDKDFELALDSARPELERANDLAEVIASLDARSDFEEVREWAKAIGMRTDRGGDGCASFTWDAQNLLVPLKGMGGGASEQKVYGTFSRAQALEDESLQFFAPGHKLIDALVYALRTGPVGRATVFARALGPEHRSKMFLLVAGTCNLDQSCWEGEVPAGLIARAHRRLWPDAVTVPLQLRLGGDPSALPVTEGPLREALLEGFGGSERDIKIDAATLFSSLKGPERLWPAFREAVEIGLGLIRERRIPVVSEAVRLLEEDLRHELSYLRGLVDREGDENAEVELALREMLLESMRHEQIRLDALALVIAI